MSHSDTIIVILAAGKGTRLKSGVAKVLHQAGGCSLVAHVIRACQALGARATIVVTGYQSDQVSAVAESLGARTVLQAPLNGTGHALLAARKAIPRDAARVLVVPGDAPLIRTATLAALLDAHEKSGAAAAVLTAKLPSPTGYGRVVRSSDGRSTNARGAGGDVAAIVEEKSATPEQWAICEVNSSIYSFTLARLWPPLEQIRPDNFHGEIYLTDVIAQLHQRGDHVAALCADDAQEVLGCNTRAELADVDRIFRVRKASALMEAGVTLYLPETIVIDADVEAGMDTVIQPGAQLLGRTRIGERCAIGAGCVLVDADVADDVEIKPHSLVLNSRLGAGTGVGPFAHIRDGAELRPGARIGNFVEVKKSTIGEGAKAMHLSYLGDATIGAATNIGAGTITCNYDGVRKNPTTIGDRVFIGSGTELVAPVSVGSSAYVAAGSTITENVPADSLAIARSRQVNKEGWATFRARFAQEGASAPAHPARGDATKSKGPGRPRRGKGKSVAK
jgi:bifunctional UDP-N-acetylglucosamine pyrophosphorylase/glucosamine-1-phosphate N-acetyltransferase